jgi:hypothetical protein
VDVIEIVKAKVPPDKLPNDAILKVHVAEVRQAILTFCNRPEIPNELVYVHANMVVDVINEEERKTNPDGDKDVKSIKEGDTQISYENRQPSTSESSTKGILYNYKSQLMNYRKLRW